MITQDIQHAIDVLRQRDVVAIPTETVYGLAGNAYDEVAVKKIYALKQRPLYNPLIVHIASADRLSTVAQHIPDKAYQLAKQCWPGPLTMVLNKKNHIPDVVTAQQSTVAVRVPQHPLTQALLAQIDFPLAAPSANPFGSISPTRASHVAQYFGKNLEVILDGGDCMQGIESTIVGFSGEQVIVYRMGSISIEQLEKEIGRVEVVTHASNSPQAPGMLSRHYAPQTPLYVTEVPEAMLAQTSITRIGVLRFQSALQHPNIIHQEILSPSGNFAEAAKNLYAAMHRLDNCGAQVIIAERLPDYDLGKTINDKLQRASQT